MRPIRCLVADNTAVSAYGIERALHLSNAGVVVATVSRVEDLPAAIAETKPDLVVMALEPIQESIDGLVNCSVPTLVYTSSVRRSDELRSVQGGARGFISKESKLTDLLKSMEAVANGNTWFVFGEESSDGDVLTSRERELVRLVVAGRSNKQLAAELGIATQTVKNHLHTVMRKLDLESRSQLCAWGLKRV